MNYDDIINLPHHVSERHPHMSVSDRAAQFAPFAALTGYGDVIKETARLTETRPELSEDEKARMDQTLRAVLNTQGENAGIVVTYFVPDARKSGGAYRRAAGKLRRVDEAEDTLILEIPEGEEGIALLPVRMEDILSVHVDKN